MIECLLLSLSLLLFYYSATRGQTELPLIDDKYKSLQSIRKTVFCNDHSLFPKPLPPSPTSGHSAAKQPAFSPSLPEHVYQNCFGNAGGTSDWNNSLQCLSLKFENLWDAAVMKSWNPSVLLPESLPGKPPQTDVPTEIIYLVIEYSFNFLSINRGHAWTTTRRSSPSNILYWPSRGPPFVAHPRACFLVVVFIFIIVNFIVLLFRSQRAEEEWRQEEMSLQFSRCLHGDQPRHDGHLCFHVLCVVYCHHCPVK